MRPYLETYKGVRIDTSEELWNLYAKASVPGEIGSKARKELYEKAGAGGWDDVCLYCPKHRYEHWGDSSHVFISEEE